MIKDPDVYFLFSGSRERAIHIHFTKEWSVGDLEEGRGSYDPPMTATALYIQSSMKNLPFTIFLELMDLLVIGMLSKLNFTYTILLHFPDI